MYTHSVDYEATYVSLENFKKKIQEYMPTIFLGSEDSIYERDVCVEMIVTPRCQFNIPTIAEKMERMLLLDTLYVFQSGDKRCIWTMMFSKPVENEMYSVYLTSNQYGLTEQLRVSFYDSIEVMHDALADAWHRSFSYGGIYVDGISNEAELMKYFI